MCVGNNVCASKKKLYVITCVHVIICVRACVHIITHIPGPGSSEQCLRMCYPFVLWPVSDSEPLGRNKITMLRCTNYVFVRNTIKFGHDNHPRKHSYTFAPKQKVVLLPLQQHHPTQK